MQMRRARRSMFVGKYDEYLLYPGTAEIGGPSYRAEMYSIIR